MEALKKGGVPDLKPLMPKQPAPQGPDAAPPQLPGQQAPTPASIPIPPPRSFPAPPTPTPPKPVLPTEPKPSPLQTYSSDFSDRIKNTGASTATILAAEQDSGTTVVEERTSRGSAVAVIAGVLLLLIGGAGAYIAYTQYVVKMSPVPVIVPTGSAPIFVDEREKISGTSATELLQEIQQSLTRTLAPNSVRLLYTDQSTTSDKSVFSALQLPAPAVLLRNVNAANSMAGIINTGAAQTPFFILSVTSYSDTFAGMLAWEPTISRDLATLFPPYPAAVIATTTATTTKSKATTTKAKTATTATAPATFSVFFHDEVVGNHDVRVYRDAEGRSILLYGYWNQKTLVIARDPSVFVEILSRLATARP